MPHENSRTNSCGVPVLWQILVDTSPAMAPNRTHVIGRFRLVESYALQSTIPRELSGSLIKSRYHLPQAAAAHPAESRRQIQTKIYSDIDKVKAVSCLNCIDIRNSTEEL
jgi:hypothetical protein